MTDKPITEKPIINPFKDVDNGALMAKIVTFPQASFLYEAHYEGGFKPLAYDVIAEVYVVKDTRIPIAVETDDIEIEQNDKIYVCRRYMVQYGDESSGPCMAYEEGFDSNPRSYRTVDILIIAPQDLSIPASEFKFRQFFEGFINNSEITLEFTDTNLTNKTAVFDEKKNVVPNGVVVKDVSKLPASFFLREPETFITKFSVGQDLNEFPQRSDFYVRLSYLSYKDLGLISK